MTEEVERCHTSVGYQKPCKTEKQAKFKFNLAIINGKRDEHWKSRQALREYREDL